ncbi:MAG: diguanylate cyclase [Alphaproteobacteria bacterium]|nr:diguanylate cyclase [Alphaproteobacteria bacterium]
MKSKKPGPPPTPESGLQLPTGPDRDEVIRQLEDGLVELEEIQDALYRSALCRTEPSIELTSEQSQYLTRFGGWLDLNMGRGLLDQPAFEQLIETYGIYHEHLRWLARRAWKGGKVPADEFDGLSAKRRAVLSQIRRLLRLFRTAESTVDPLTGVQNRQVMKQVLAREMNRAERTREGVFVVLADIDFFKKVNDTYGHRAGDAVLAGVAALLTQGLRPYDSIFRYGGEEFLLCLPSSKAAAVRAVLERLRKNIEAQSFAVDGGRVLNVTCSFGGAPLDPAIGVEKSVEVADMALYKAKETGRNRVVLAQARPRSPAERLAEGSGGASGTEGC